MNRKRIALIVAIAMFVFVAQGISEAADAEILRGHTGYVSSVAFSSDGQTLASGSYDRTVRLWDVNTGTQLKIITGHTGYVSSVAFSSDGQTLASGSYDRTVRLWDVNTGTQLKIITGHTGYVSSVAFSSDGQTLASGSWDKTVRLWDVSALGIPADILVIPPGGRPYEDLTKQHGGDVRSVAYSPWGVVLASGGTDDTMRLWRTTNGEALSTYEHGGDVNSIAFTPNDTWIASGSDDGTVRVWKWNTDEDTWVEAQELEIEGNRLNNNVLSVAFSHDNTMLACGTNGNDVLLYDYNPDDDKWVYRTALKDHQDNVNSVAFRPGVLSWQVQAMTTRCGCGMRAQVRHFKRSLGIQRMSTVSPLAKMVAV